MKNKKGFTMVELLAVIVILGILSTLAIAGIRGVLKRTKESYMDSQNKMVVLAGKTYYSDHRSRLPKVIGPIEEVELQTLVDLKYIDPVKDANGELCVTETDTKKSKVFVQKVSNEEYKYNAYLYCNGKESGINDTVPPNITINPMETNGVSNKPVTVTMKIEDNESVLSYRYIIMKDGKEYEDTGYKNYKKTVSIKLTENGVYTIKAYAYDTSGNKSEKESKKYILDIPKPTCETEFTLTANKPSTNWQKTNINITVSTSKGPGIESWTVKDSHYDNKTKTTKVKTLIKRTTSEKKTFSLTENGEHTIIIEGYNSVGGYCSKRFDNQVYKIDKEVPSAPVLEGNPNKWVNYSFSLTGTTKEEYSGINYWQYSYDRSNWTTYASSSKNPFTTTAFSAERNQNVYIRTVDKAGNISQPASSRIKIDKTKPTVSFTTGPGPHKNNGGIRVYGKCSDNKGGSGVARFTGNGTFVSSPTKNTPVTLGCSDNAGNYSSLTNYFYVQYYSVSNQCGSYACNPYKCNCTTTTSVNCDLTETWSIGKCKEAGGWMEDRYCCWNYKKTKCDTCYHTCYNSCWHY